MASASATPSPTALTPRSHHEEVMGTVVTIDVFSEAAVGMDNLISAACARLHEADHTFTTWDPDSPLSRFRRGEISLDQAPPAVAEVLELCVVARRLSWGWFDPWAMPGGYDPTGYVKGWAAKRALEAIEGLDVRGAIVNAAGDVAAFGSVVPGQSIRIGVVDPFNRRRLACVVESPGAVATSGSSERAAHLLDPRTGSPSEKLASATVCGTDLGLADALATGLAVAGAGGLAFVEAVDGYEALTIDHDGRWQWTEGFPFVHRPSHAG